MFCFPKKIYQVSSLTRQMCAFNFLCVYMFACFPPCSIILSWLTEASKLIKTSNRMHVEISSATFYGQVCKQWYFCPVESKVEYIPILDQIQYNFLRQMLHIEKLKSWSDDLMSSQIVQIMTEAMYWCIS